MWKTLWNTYFIDFSSFFACGKLCGKSGEFSTEYKYLLKVFHIFHKVIPRYLKVIHKDFKVFHRFSTGSESIFAEINLKSDQIWTNPPIYLLA
jgi:hypothetical protein